MALAPSVLFALQNYRQSLNDAIDLYNFYQPFFMNWTLTGYANWVMMGAAQKSQARQEVENYLNLHGHPLENLILLNPVPPLDPLNALEELLKQEVKCTLIIEDASDLPALNNDRISYIFISDLVEEQVEEEATASELLDRSRLFFNGLPPKFGLELLDDWLM